MPPSHTRPPSRRLRRYGPILAFLVPSAVRAVPEILMGPYPTGFDPMGYYVPIVLTWLREGVGFWRCVATAPLLYLLLILATSLRAPLTLTLKALAPLLHGLLSLTIYTYATKALKWPPGKSVCTALLATLYFVAMRVSWDLLRNQLALALLFTALTLLQERDNTPKNVAASLTMALVVLTNQLASVVMFAITAATIAATLLKGEKTHARKLTLISLPSVLLFLLVLYANFRLSTHFAETFYFPRQEPEGHLSLFGFQSYPEMAATAAAFTAYCYLPLTPPALKGAKTLKDTQLRAWTLFCLLAPLTPVVFARFWYRWTLMLTYPLSFYAVEGVANITSKTRRLYTSIALATTVAVLTSTFIATPCDRPFPYYAIRRFQIYIPSSMLQNTVPLEDCPHVEDCLNWLKQNMDENSILIVHKAFHGWALLHLNPDQIQPYGYGNPETAAKQALQQGHNTVYLIWWTQGKGWHGQPSAPPSFKEVYRSGDIAIYVYASSPDAEPASHI